MRPQRGINLCKAAKYRVLNRARIIWSRFARSYRRSRERHVDFVSHYCSRGGRVLRKKWGNSTISDGCFGASKMMMIARWQMPRSVFGWFFFSFTFGTSTIIVVTVDFLFEFLFHRWKLPHGRDVVECAKSDVFIAWEKHYACYEIID